VTEIEAAVVRHYTSRAGDPHRHLHLQINARVWAAGKWRGRTEERYGHALPRKGGGARRWRDHLRTNVGAARCAGGIDNERLADLSAACPIPPGQVISGPAICRHERQAG